MLTGKRELKNLIEQYGLENVQNWMAELGSDGAEVCDYCDTDYPDKGYNGKLYHESCIQAIKNFERDMKN